MKQEELDPGRNGMLTQHELVDLGRVTGQDLDDLCAEAVKIRHSYWGRAVSYSRKVFIPLTNMCRDSCGYCTFVKTPETGQAYLMTPSQIRKTIQAGERLGCQEALFSLGEKPELKYQLARDLLAAQGYDSMVDYLEAMCQMVLSETSLLPHVNAGTLQLAELRRLKQVSASMGLMLENSSKRLHQPGMAHYACPDKVPLQRLRTIARAGQLDIPFTTGMLIGIGENWAERIQTLLDIRDLHQQYGHIQEVIIQNFRAKPGTAMADSPEPDRDDMRRTLAVARICLPPEISLQAPPNLEQDYIAYLAAGLNDWGGISPLTQDFINPECAWPEIERLEKLCQGQNYQLIQRQTIYPRFAAQSHRYLAAPLQPLFQAQQAVVGQEV